MNDEPKISDPIHKGKQSVIPSTIRRSIDFGVSGMEFDGPEYADYPGIRWVVVAEVEEFVATVLDERNDLLAALKEAMDVFDLKVRDITREQKEKFRALIAKIDQGGK